MIDELSQAKQLLLDVAPYFKAGKPHEALSVMAQAVDMIRQLDATKIEQKKVFLLLEKVVHRVNMDAWLRRVGLKALEYKPGEEHVLFNHIQRLREDLRLAEKYFEQRELENEIRRIDSLYAKGVEYVKVGDSRRALAIFNKVARDYDSAPELLINMGNQLKEMGEHFGAVSFFERAVQKEPDNPEYHTLAAYAFQRIRQLDKAEEYFLSSLKGCDDAAQNYLNLAKFYTAARLWDKAHEAIQQSLDRNPHDPQAHDMLRLIEQKVYVHDPGELKKRNFLMDEDEEEKSTSQARRNRLLGKRSE